MEGGYKKFKSPKKEYSDFKTTARPKSPSPKRKDFEKVAVRTSNKHSRCTYIHPSTDKRCKLMLGKYPKFCYLHTMLIENLYIDNSNIKNGGNGLFAGPMGFKKGDIIGEYSMPWMKVKSGQVDRRNKGHPDTSYLFCDYPKRGQKEEDAQCWDGLDIRSTIVRYANDAHGSKFKNNSEFSTVKSKTGNHVYMVAKQKIAPFDEIFCTYGEDYW